MLTLSPPWYFFIRAKNSPVFSIGAAFIETNTSFAEKPAFWADDPSSTFLIKVPDEEGSVNAVFMLSLTLVIMAPKDAERGSSWPKAHGVINKGATSKKKEVLFIF